MSELQIKLLWGIFILMNALIIDIIWNPRITKNRVNGHWLLFYTCNKKIHRRAFIDLTQIFLK